MENRCPYMREKENKKYYCKIKEVYVDNEKYKSCCCGEGILDYMKCQDYMLFAVQNPFVGNSMVFSAINED